MLSSGYFGVDFAIGNWQYLVMASPRLNLRFTDAEFQAIEEIADRDVRKPFEWAKLVVLLVAERQLGIVELKALLDEKT